MALPMSPGDLDLSDCHRRRNDSRSGRDALSGNGVGGTSRVIIAGGTTANSIVTPSPSSVIVTGGTLTSGGVGGTNMPAGSP